MFDKIAARLHGYRPEVCEPIIGLAVEIAREGREGRRVGTMLIVGDADNVLAHSRPLILDPIALHPAELRNIGNENLRRTLKNKSSHGWNRVCAVVQRSSCTCRI